MRPLQPGDTVRLRTPDQKHWGGYGKILEKCGPRSYLIDTGNGVYRRNRRHILVVPHNEPNVSFPLPETEHDDPDDTPPREPDPGNAEPARRYPLRQRRMPVRFRDYHMD